VDGVLQNEYALNPFWYYFDEDNIEHTIMEDYDRSIHGELTYGTIYSDGSDALLSKSTDLLTNKVTKYGYDYGKPTAAVTYDTEDNVLSQETFVYDDIDRLTRDNFYYTLPNNSVTSEIEYDTQTTDHFADNRVKTYSYKIGGTEKAKTENSYDTYKRITNKKYTVDGRVFNKSVEYSKTRVNKVIDSVGGTTLYEYDNMGRISAASNLSKS
jgi:hypothetical protein